MPKMKKPPFNLTIDEALQVVLWWYLHYESSIFQDEHGRDLEEVVEQEIYQ